MDLETAVGIALRKKKKTLAIAESCTGGLISDRITDSSGSSDYFVAGIVAYSNGIKENILGVSDKSIKRYGAVSGEVALQMAKGVQLLSGASLGIGVTGIAGPLGVPPKGVPPKGGTRKKPVGLVYIALVADKKRMIKEFRFRGSRKSIKLQASQAALDLIIKNI